MICQIIGSAGYYATHLYFTEFMAVVISLNKTLVII